MVIIILSFYFSLINDLMVLYSFLNVIRDVSSLSIIFLSNFFISGHTFELRIISGLSSTVSGNLSYFSFIFFIICYSSFPLKGSFP